MGGSVILALLVSVLGLSTVFTFWYYGSKCLGFLIGAKYQHHYIWFYIVLLVIGAGGADVPRSSVRFRCQSMWR